jgi:hypothetical protein
MSVVPTDDEATGSAPQTELGQADAAVQAFHGVWASMTSSFSGGSLTAAGGIVRARTGIPLPTFNGVWGAETRVSADAVVAAVQEFAADDLPWNLQLRPGYPVELDDELARHGLVVTAEVPFMVLVDPGRFEDTVAATPATLRRSESFADFDSVMSLLEQGFGMPAALTREIFPMRMFFLPGTTTWIAAAGQDVSTSLGITVEGKCGVFNVATPEAHRGNGYGAAVTARTVQAAFAEGARTAFLQSSPMGYSVYEKLGFVAVERWRQWMPAQYAEHE